MGTEAKEDPFSSDELDELYRDIILDYHSSPRNKGRLSVANASKDGYNPLCGDEVTIDLMIQGNVIKDVNFDGRGCSISQSSASMMTDAIKGRTLEEISSLFIAFTDTMKGSAANEEILGDLEALKGVSKFPVRVKCATLAWHTMNKAIESFLVDKGNSPDQ